MAAKGSEDVVNYVANNPRAVGFVGALWIGDRDDPADTSFLKEIKVVALQCKLKLNQHRPESHAAMRAAYGNGDENQRELVRWMDKLKL